MHFRCSFGRENNLCRHLTGSWYLIVLGFFLLSGCTDNFITRDERALDVETRSLEWRIHQLVNEYRHRNNLRSLNRNALIDYFARRHSREMAAGNVPVGHEGFEDRVKVISWMYHKRQAAENVSYMSGHQNYAHAFVDGWLRSPHHLANMSGTYYYTGIGVKRGRDGGYYATQIFWR